MCLYIYFFASSHKKTTKLKKEEERRNLTNPNNSLWKCESYCSHTVVNASHVSHTVVQNIFII